MRIKSNIDKFFKVIKSYFITFSLIINNFTNILLSYMEGPISTTIDYLVDQSQTQQVRRPRPSAIVPEPEVTPVPVEEES
jgi:vesicle coat complex subunit